MKWFGRVLLSGWLLLALFIAAEFTFPKEMSHLFGWVAPFIVLPPLVLVMSSAVFALLFVYRLGMRRH